MSEHTAETLELQSRLDDEGRDRNVCIEFRSWRDLYLNEDSLPCIFRITSIALSVRVEVTEALSTCLCIRIQSMIKTMKSERK
jgi:hypothetical protein